MDSSASDSMHGHSKQTMFELKMLNESQKRVWMNDELKNMEREYKSL